MATKDMEALEKELSYYKKVNDSLGQGIVQLEAKILGLNDTIQSLMAEKMQWDTQKVIQEKIIRETLEKSNALNQEHQVEIQRLKDELKNNDHNDNVVVHSRD